jgi:hypothetical protein
VRQSSNHGTKTYCMYGGDGHFCFAKRIISTIHSVVVDCSSLLVIFCYNVCQMYV